MTKPRGSRFTGFFLCLSVTVTYIAEKIEKKFFSEK